MNNASTREDVTNYFDVVPSNHLQRLLWAEAERMSNLDVNEANFKSERAVVQEEYRQRVLRRSVRSLLRGGRAALVCRPSVRRGVIGNIGELDAASLDDVRTFHRTYYRPDNACSSWPATSTRRSSTPGSTSTSAPSRARGAHPAGGRASSPRARQERAIGKPGRTCRCPPWRSPGSDRRRRSPDAAALHVAAALLANGESSRLNQALVYRGQIAQKAAFALDPTIDTGTRGRLRDRRQGRHAGQARRGAQGGGREACQGPHSRRRSSPRSSCNWSRRRWTSGRRRSARRSRWARRDRIAATRRTPTAISTSCRRSPRPTCSACCASTCSTASR